MSELTVSEKVDQLRSEALRLATAEKGADEARRIGSRVMKLKVALGSLSTQVELARKVNETIGSTRVDLSTVDDGYEEFVAKVRSVTNPSNGVFERANRRITAVCNKLEGETSSAWSTWASARISELHLKRIPMLPPKDQHEARRKLDELERLSRAKDLSRSTVSLFTTSIGGLADMLADVPDAPREVTSLMEKLSNDRPPTLAEITDDEISLLRSLHLDAQITVKRIGT